MKFGKAYWAMMIVIALLLVLLGVMRYGGGVALTGFFSQSTAAQQGIGNTNAKAVVSLYCDYQDYYCLKANELAQKIANENNKVYFIIKQYPVGNKPYDYMAALAATCAQNQGLLIEVNSALLNANYDLSEEKILQLSRSASGIDVGEFNDCYSKEATKSQIFSDIVEAQNAGVDSVPAFVFGENKAEGTNMDVIESQIRSWLS